MREFFGFVFQLSAAFVTGVTLTVAFLLGFGLEAGLLWLAVLGGGLAGAALLFGLGTLLARKTGMHRK